MKIRHHLCTHFKGIEVHSLATMYGQKLGGCHVAVEIDWEDGEIPLIYEAVKPRSRCLPKDVWRTEYSPVETWEYDITELKRFVEHEKLMLSLMYKPYSMGQIYLIMIGSMFRLLDSYLGKKVWNGRFKTICAEIMAISIEFLGHKFEESLDTVDLKDCVAGAESLVSRGIGKKLEA